MSKVVGKAKVPQGRGTYGEPEQGLRLLKRTLYRGRSDRDDKMASAYSPDSDAAVLVALLPAGCLVALLWHLQLADVEHLTKELLNPCR